MKLGIIVCALFAFAGLTTSVNAQCGTHRNFYTYSNTYQYPVREVVVQEVVTPVAVPVLIPAFQFQYMPPCAVAPVATAGVTPVVPGYTPMQTAAPAPAASPIATDEEKIRLLARSIIAEMNKQMEAGQQDNGPPMAVGQPVQMSFVNVLANRCAGCHTGASARGGVQIFTADGRFNIGVDRQRIIRAIEDGRMPPQAVNDPAHRVPANEIELIRNAFR